MSKNIKLCYNQSLVKVIQNYVDSKKEKLGFGSAEFVVSILSLADNQDAIIITMKNSGFCLSKIVFLSSDGEVRGSSLDELMLKMFSKTFS